MGDQVALDASGQALLNSAGELATECDTNTCYYPLKNCDDDSDSGFYIATSSAVEGVCPTFPNDAVYQDDAGETCYYIDEGTAGTIEPQDLLPTPYFAIETCEDCGVPIDECFDCGCDVISVTVEITGMIIDPTCCPAPMNPTSEFHFEILEPEAFNGTWELVPHAACSFRIVRTIPDFLKIIYRLGPTETGVDDCDAPEESEFDDDITVNGTLRLTVGPAGTVSAGIEWTLDDPAWSFLNAFIVLTSSTGSSGDICDEGNTTTYGDATTCQTYSSGGFHPAFAGSGSIKATANLDCPGGP